MPFEVLSFHYRHCFYSTSHPSKDSAVLRLAKLLLMKYKNDPELTSLKTLAQASPVKSLDALALIKASAVSQLV